MKRYIARRLLLIIPTLFFLGTLLFIILQAIPGDVASALLAGPEIAANPKAIAELRRELGLSDPFYVQYFRWLGQIGRGNLGYSAYFGMPVWEALKPKFEVTLTLGILAMVFSVVLSIPPGVLAAMRRGSIVDNVIRTVSAGGMAIPAFWLGIIVLLILSRVIGWMPPAEHHSFLEDPVGTLQRFVFPALIIGFRAGAAISRMTRSMMLEVLSEDYVRTARAKGLRRGAVIVRHALPNALLPVITMLGILVAQVISGAVVLETIFNLPGVGLFLVESVKGRDAVTVLSIVLFIGIFTMLWILITDVSYRALDPRVTYE